MVDFSVVTDGKAKADEVILKNGLAIAALVSLEANENGSSFPELATFNARVLERLRAKAKSVSEKHGADALPK